MPAIVNRTMTPTEWGLLLFLSLLWGGSFFFNAVAVTALPPFTIVAVRVLLGSVFLTAVLRITGGRLPTDRRSLGPSRRWASSTTSSPSA